MITHHLFPTPVAAFQLGRPLTDEEIEFVSDQPKKPNSGNETSGDRFLNKRKEIAPLFKFFQSSVNTYLKDIACPKNDKLRLRITQAWANYTKHGQYHHKHSHPNSYISGVFYIKTNPTDKINFFKPGYQQLKIPVEGTKFNLYNSDSWWLEAKAGELLIFPSSLEHMVETTIGKDLRISLSFNTFPVGEVGDDDMLTGLKLKE